MLATDKSKLLSSHWKYYQNAIIPASPPHQPPPLLKESKKQLFRQYPKALFIRWYSDYDCPEETTWWYCIKDSVYDPASMKAKRRYEITKGQRYFEVRKISAREYAEALCTVWVESLRGYKGRDQMHINVPQQIRQIGAWDDASHLTVFGAFFRDTNQLCGFTLIAKQDVAIHLSSLKTIPEFEKYGVNAALMDGVLSEYNPLIQQGYYICDGARNVLHETNFQNYLERSFGFRKAYCRLHICYRFGVGFCVKVLCLFRGMLKKLDSLAIIHKINGIIAMETYREKPLRNRPTR